MTLPVLNPGVQLDVITEATAGSGVTARDLIIQSDAVLATLSVTAISGTLDVAVYAIVGDAEQLILTFPTVSAPTVLEILHSETTTSNLRVRAQYSGACSYRVQCRAVMADGSSATAANQAAEIALLTSIDSTLSDIDTSTNNIEATLASIDTSANNIEASVAAIDIDTSAIATSVAAIDIDTSAIAASTAGIDSSANAIEASTASIDGKLNSLGQKTMTGSVPVVLASDQSDVSIGHITGPVALPTGAATAANQTTANTSLANIDADTTLIANSVASIDTKVATAANQATANASLAAIDADTTAIATSVASIDTSANAIEASVASIDAGTPAALGQTTMSASMPVVLASDQAGSTTVNGTVALNVFVANRNRRTYSACSTQDFVAANLATDIFTITGSATTTVRILKMGITILRQSTAYNNIVLLKRSTANSGGTSAAATAVSHDSADAAATATVLTYTANPTTGTLVGNMRNVDWYTPASNGVSQTLLEWDFSDIPEKSPVLRGTGELLAFNLAGVTINGNTINCYVEWTEE